MNAVPFLPEAREEFLAAAEHYDLQEPGLGEEFIAEVEHATEQPFRSTAALTSLARGEWYSGVSPTASYIFANSRKPSSWPWLITVADPAIGVAGCRQCNSRSLPMLIIARLAAGAAGLYGGARAGYLVEELGC